jgi:hypothetical protein
MSALHHWLLCGGLAAHKIKSTHILICGAAAHFVQAACQYLPINALDADPAQVATPVVKGLMRACIAVRPLMSGPDERLLKVPRWVKTFKVLHRLQPMFGYNECKLGVEWQLTSLAGHVPGFRLHFVHDCSA